MTFYCECHGTPLFEVKRNGKGYFILKPIPSSPDVVHTAGAEFNLVSVVGEAFANEMAIPDPAKLASIAPATILKDAASVPQSFVHPQAEGLH